MNNYNYKYNAFISFSEPDSDLARTLQRALERFAKPWYRRRALNLFREQPILAITHEPYQHIAEAIDDSEYYILVASPAAAESKGVNHDLERFLHHHSLEHVLIVLTAGQMQWSKIDRDFDWNETTALPQTLKGKFKYEPLFVDLRHRAESGLTSSDVATIAASLHGKDKDSIYGKELFPEGRSARGPIHWIKDAWNAVWRTSDTRAEGHLQTQEVALGVSAPKSAHPSDQFTASFAAYIETERDDVGRQLKALSPRSETHLGIQVCRWQRGTNVCVRAEGRHLHIEPPEFHFVWQGRRILCSFDVTVQSDAPETTTVLKFDISIAEVVVARLRLDVEIALNPSETGMQSVRGYPARSAFASYSSSDRVRVLDRVAEIERSGMDVFLDCLSLHPGEDWKPKIATEIGDRDVLLLFWSIHARTSQWVEWEWRKAFDLKGIEGIEPHPLDPVDDAEPPVELRDLQFNDRYMLVRRYYKMRRDCEPTTTSAPPNQSLDRSGRSGENSMES